MRVSRERAKTKGERSWGGIIKTRRVSRWCETRWRKKTKRTKAGGGGGGRVYGFDYRVQRVSKVHVRVASTRIAFLPPLYPPPPPPLCPRNRINRFHTFVREIDVSLYISVWRKCEGNVRFTRETESTPSMMSTAIAAVKIFHLSFPDLKYQIIYFFPRLLWTSAAIKCSIIQFSRNNIYIYFLFI